MIEIYHIRNVNSFKSYNESLYTEWESSCNNKIAKLFLFLNSLVCCGPFHKSWKTLLQRDWYYFNRYDLHVFYKHPYGFREKT